MRRSPFILFFIMYLVNFQTHAEISEVVMSGIGSIKVHVGIFIPKQHKIESCGDYICLIDGNLFFGSDGKIPSKNITKIVFLHNGFKTDLDVSSMYDPNINNDNIKSRIRAEPFWGQSYKITGYFSDGSGSYIAQWIVTKNGSIRTHISDTENLYELFRKVSGK